MKWSARLAACHGVVGSGRLASSPISVDRDDTVYRPVVLRHTIQQRLERLPARHRPPADAGGKLRRRLVADIIRHLGPLIRQGNSRYLTRLRSYDSASEVLRSGRQ